MKKRHRDIKHEDILITMLSIVLLNAMDCRGKRQEMDLEIGAT